MKLILARVLYEFDLELTKESKDWGSATQRVFTLWEKPPLLIKLKGRN
jgi:hypothetical protein